MVPISDALVSAITGHCGGNFHCRYAQESSPIKRASASASSHVVADRPLHLCAAQHQPAPRRNPHQLRQQAHDRTSKTSTPQAPLDRQPITLGDHGVNEHSSVGCKSLGLRVRHTRCGLSPRRRVHTDMSSRVGSACTRRGPTAAAVVKAAAVKRWTRVCQHRHRTRSILVASSVLILCAAPAQQPV